MVNIVKSKIDLFLISLLFLILPLFFYQLGQSSLGSFDEAWYGDIARNILKTGNPLLLQWNGRVYNDHPPVGFWLIALSEKLLGVSEFSVRLVPAICGFLSLIIIYLLGKELFNRWIGFASAIGLSSATWFLFRARSGNLDVILTMFFLLTLYLALKASKDRKFLLPFSISLSMLFLTKSIVPLTIVPAMIVIFWKQKAFNLKHLVVSIIIFTVIVGSWFIVQKINQPSFLSHYLTIGLPGVKAETFYHDNLRLIKEYLHNGIGKWFWPGVASIFLGLFFRQRRFLILSIFFLTFFIPFVFSSKGHIWHLIPLYPAMILATFGFVYTLMEKFIKNKKIIIFLLLIVSVYTSFIQIKRNWDEFVNIPAFVSDEAILSKEASKYPQQFYIDGDFLPTAVFYSDKLVKQISHDELQPMFEGNKEFLMITYQWRLDEVGVLSSKYKKIKADRDKLLLLKQ